jgi:dTDP-D-glucose 4,6-dehydratase
LSAEKIQDRLGWTASVDLENGLRMSIEWYNEKLSELS